MASSIRLKTSDGRRVLMKEAVAAQSETLRVVKLEEWEAFPVQVTSEVLMAVIYYCHNHIDTIAADAAATAAAAALSTAKADLAAAEAGESAAEEIAKAKKILMKAGKENKEALQVKEKADLSARNFDSKFLEDNKRIIPDILLAADDMKIPSLVDLITQFMSDTMIKGKTPDEIRANFKLENEFGEVEYKQREEQNQWALENPGILD